MNSSELSPEQEQWLRVLRETESHKTASDMTGRLFKEVMLWKKSSKVFYATYLQIIDNMIKGPRDD